MRDGPYDALKVDVWSVGATVWELAETVPPFSISADSNSQATFSLPDSKQWPPLSHPEHYSRGFREFLRLCGVEAATRPSPAELLNVRCLLSAWVAQALTCFHSLNSFAMHVDGQSFASYYHSVELWRKPW